MVLNALSKFWRNSGISRPSGWLPHRPKDCSWVRQLAGERCAAKGNNGFAFEACKESCFACGQPCHDGDWKDSEGHDCKYVAKQLLCSGAENETRRRVDPAAATRIVTRG